MALDQYERYQILARIGSGGMADVYLGVHLGEQQFRQLVVIKRISPEFIKNAAARQMFIDEALIVANLAHPHIVQIHDLREIDGGLSIAMEYVNGESLAFLLKQLRNMGQRLPIDVACKLIAVVTPPKPAAPKVNVVPVEPKAKPAPKVPKTAYLSGNGNWSGSKVWRSSCGTCHARPSPNKLTERKWKRLLRPHNRHAKGKFSRSELSKVASYVVSKITKDTKTGVAGVQ